MDTQTSVLAEGLGFGESPRWHDGRLWFANWGTQEIVAVDLDGNKEVITHAPTTVPYSIDWLPDGRLLIICGPEGKLLDGSLNVYADLGHGGFNELVVDSRGNAYVNGTNIVLVTPQGEVREVATGLAWGNGMAITPDNSTLIVAESHAKCLTAFDIASDGSLSSRRIWAGLGDGVPDGICLDRTGAIWYADVPNKRCVRVREGGEILAIVQADRGCFACALGGADEELLFIVAAQWLGMDRMHEALSARSGQLLVTTLG